MKDKKNFPLSLDISSSKPTRQEWVSIITFALAIFIFLDFPIAFSLTIGVTGMYLFIEKVIRMKGKKRIDFYNKLSFYGRKFLSGLIALFFIDMFLTWLAVHRLQIAYEGNRFPIWLWDTFGYAGGEFFRFLLFSCAIFYPMWIFINSRGEKRIFVAFIFSLISLVVWGYVVVHNFLILWSYWCYG